jgi:hypothetical protein
MRYFFTLFIFCLLSSNYSFAFTVSGTIKEKNGKPLPYASVLIKGTAQGTTANSKGFYSIQLNDGVYTLVCQHVGHKAFEQKITINHANATLDFELEPQEYNLSAVVVKANREDPAYAIIRNAIKKREEHLNENKKFQCEVYLKGQLQLRNYPKNFFGQKVDFEDGDTSKRKMIFLSETVARYSVEKPNDAKVEVLSTRVSGNSDGFGFSSPNIISLYQNIVSIGRGLNPRGFISPIGNNALNYYQYKFEGTFFENGKEISRIKVIPKRRYEPLFSGYISIIENEWRIYSTQLYLLKEQQMQLLDTLHIEQLYVPLKDTWVIKQQVVYPAGKIFGFDFFGSFVQVYNQFNIEPAFKKKFFDNTLIKFLDSSNKKPAAYWDSVRPIPLLDNEAKDYKKKDSLEQARKDPHYLDSLDKIRNKITFSKLFFTGQNFNNEKNKSSISINPLIVAVGIYYNPAEGRVTKFGINYFKRYEGRQSLSIKPSFRYGYTRKNFNPMVDVAYNFGTKYTHLLDLSAGSDVFQFNNANPISEINNTLSSYYWQHNYLKSYMANFVKASYTAGLGGGVSVRVALNYQQRTPMDNVIDSLKGKAFTPNYPTEQLTANIQEHKALSATLSITWRPGAKYIEFPDRKISIGSKYPTLNASITKGIKGALGSAVDYTKWKFTINDNLNLKLGGRISYQVELGGFIK